MRLTDRCAAPRLPPFHATTHPSTSDSPIQACTERGRHRSTPPRPLTRTLPFSVFDARSCHRASCLVPALRSPSRVPLTPPLTPEQDGGFEDILTCVRSRFGGSILVSQLGRLPDSQGAIDAPPRPSTLRHRRSIPTAGPQARPPQRS